MNLRNIHLIMFGISFARLKSFRLSSCFFLMTLSRASYPKTTKTENPLIMEIGSISTTHLLNQPQENANIALAYIENFFFPFCWTT